MIKIIFQPNIVKHHTLFSLVDDNIMARYMTVTKGGMLNIWSIELKHLRAYRIDPPKVNLKKLGVWVTDTVYMANLNMLAVSLTAGTIIFYDLAANCFNPVLTLTDMDICVTCMDYWFNPEDSSQAMLIWGDARGTVATLDFDGCPSICFFQSSSNKNFKTLVSFKELMLGTTCGVKAYKLPHIHEDFVLKIKYFPQINFFMSCCRQRNTALYMADVQGKRKTIFKVSKGVFDFDFCKKNNVIVTGGKDTVVRVWNPYVPSKAVMILQGHKSAGIF